MGDISSLEHCSEAHTCCDLTGCSHCTDMKIKVTVVWTCTLVIFLFVESCHAQKLNVHWGPQSMMYLKGKHGRRFVSEDDSSVLKQGVQSWYAALRGLITYCDTSRSVQAIIKLCIIEDSIQRLQSQQFSKPSHIVSSEKVLIHFLQER